MVDYIGKNEQRWERRRAEEIEKREEEDRKEQEKWTKLRNEEKISLLQEKDRKLQCRVARGTETAGGERTQETVETTEIREGR